MKAEKLYLLGHPVAHSKSAVMYNALFQELALPWKYENLDCATQEEAKVFLEKRDFLGVNITTPYKNLAFEQASLKAASAKLAGGVNVLACKDDILLGYNTDGAGCTSFLENQGFEFSGSTLVICGTGPTARAIMHSAALAGAKKIVLVGRNKDRCRKALEAYLKTLRSLAYATIDLAFHSEGRSLRDAYEQTDFTYGSYRSLSKIFSDADLVINATPLGMNPKDKPPFDTTLLHEGQTVFDVVYGFGPTALTTEAEDQGARVFDGSGMLVAQAVASAQAFFTVADIDPDISEEEMTTLMAAAAGFNP